MSVNMNNASNTSEKRVLFSIYNYKGEVVRDVYGPTHEQLNKPKPVNCCIKGAFYLLEEERRNIRKTETHYPHVWKKEIKEIREKIVKRIKSETNWKLRVLNEQLREKNKESKDIEKTMEAAQALIKLSMSAERKANNKKKRELQPSRRSSRIAKIENEKIKKNCRGCIEDQPNQLAHVGRGGCLGEDEL